MRQIGSGRLSTTFFMTRVGGFLLVERLLLH